MIKVTSNNEKLIDELNLVVKLFYSTQDIEELNIDFNINQYEQLSLDSGSLRSLKCFILEWFYGYINQSKSHMLLFCVLVCNLINVKLSSTAFDTLCLQSHNIQEIMSANITVKNKFS